MCYSLVYMPNVLNVGNAGKDDSGKQSDNVGLIVGVSVGVIVGVTVLLLLCYKVSCYIVATYMPHMCDWAWENRFYLHVRFDLILSVKIEITSW